MNLGKLFKYAKDCAVYKDKINHVTKPVFIVRNVFYNRGAKC